MNGSGWHVELEALDQAAWGISESVADQEEFELRGLCGDTELYGHNGVHDALMEFCVNWSEGLDILTEDANIISENLTQAAKIYRSTDHNAAQGLPDPATVGGE